MSLDTMLKPIKKTGRSVLNAIAARPKLVRLHTGDKLLATGNMAWSYQGGHYYEVNVEHWLTKLASMLKSPVFYDIGANLGYYSVLISGTAKQVYSFEPSPKTRRTLGINLALNKRQNVRAFPYGLSDSEGQAKINIYSSNGNNSLFKRDIPEGHSLKLRRQQTIELRKLDSLVDSESLLPPDLIKIDVEGSELAALIGAKQTLKQHQPVVFFEYSATTSHDAGYERSRLIKLLKPLGYDFFGLSTDVKDTQLYTLQAKAVDIDNVIAVPRSNARVIKALTKLL